MSSNSTENAGSNAAAGVATGTGFTGVVLLLPDGVAKSLLLIIAPTITIIITKSWWLVTSLVEEKIRDWRLNAEEKRAAHRVKALKDDPDATAQMIEDAIKVHQAIILLQ